MTTQRTINKATWVRTSLAGLACLLAFGTTAVRGSSAQEGPRPHAPRTLDDREALLSQLAATSESVASAPVLEGAQRDGGRIAFEDYRDNNWEIYTMPSDGGAAVRLTTDGASDLEPELSADMGRIVFTSRRPGNYDLFRMNVDGSGLVQLTNTGGTDSGASWSPDGQRIVFQSNRDGDYDLYVMNADGSGVTQLTSNPDYDGEPTWSPDGKQIAFISRQTSGSLDYYLYVMNADGSNVHVLVAAPYTGRPAWSPDGAYILFDAMNAQGWQRLFVVTVANALTSEVGQFTTDGDVDVLAGTWGLHDQIYFTRVHYVYVTDQWYWDSMSIHLAPAFVGNYPSQLRQGDRAGYPSWAGPDHLPPTSSLAPGPAPYARAGTTLAWDVVMFDEGPAGYGLINAQARINGGDWTYSPACAQSGPFSAHCTYTVPSVGQIDFRARGTDAFGNTEDWPTDPARWARTLVFQQLVSGFLRDQRGLGLVNVPITGIPAYEASVVSDGAGQWSARLPTATDSFSVTATVGGSSLTRAATALEAVTPDRYGRFYIPPLDDVIVNPGFEVADTGWSPTVGSHPFWLPKPDVSTDSAVLQLNFVPGLYRPLYRGVEPAVATSGTTTFMAFGNESGSQLAVCPQSVGCVLESLPGSFVRDLATRADGAVAVVVVNPDTSRTFLERSPAGVWSAASTFPWLGQGASHDLVADSTGRWHYIWAEGDGQVHISQRLNDGSWSGASQAGSMANGSQAAFDATDVLHIVGCAASGVNEVTWSEAGGMSAPTAVSSETCGAAGYAATIVDGAGRVYAVWSSGGALRFSRRGSNGTWSAPVPFAGQALPSPGIFSGPDGRPTALTIDNVGFATVHQVSGDGLAWEALPQKLLWFGTSVSRDVLGYNWATSSLIVNNHLGYLPGGPAYENDIAVYDLIGKDGAVGTYQVVNVPVDLHRPVLSIDYRFVAGAAGEALTMHVQGLGSPTSIDLPSGAGWQHAWLDATPWAGQTVTVQIELHDSSDAHTPTADINQVSLGSWTTPVVTGLEPAQSAVAGGTLVVLGDNFMATPVVTVAGRTVATTWTDAQHLTITLPADLPVGRFALVVTNPSGHAALALSSVQIGSASFIPSLQRWAPPRP